MGGRRSITCAVWLGVVVGCGPQGAPLDTDTDGNGGSTSGSTAADTAETNPSDPTADSMSGSATTSDATTDPGDSNGASATGPDPSDGSSTAAGTGECPYGAEGCLCDVGAQCDDGLDCNDEGICVGVPNCRPIDADPHDDEETAVGLDDLGCDQGADAGLIGTIEGPQVDWYTFFGNDAGFCPEQPSAVVTADDPLEVCIYLECNNGGNVTRNCGAMTTDATSPDGREGCCGADVALVADYDCSGFGGKDVDVYISVGSDQEICADYELQYAF